MRCSTAEALRRSEEFVLRWKDHPRVNAWFSLRQLMVNTDALRQGMHELSHALETPIHTHLAEGTYEVDYAIAQLAAPGQPNIWSSPTASTTMFTRHTQFCSATTR